MLQTRALLRLVGAFARDGQSLPECVGGLPVPALPCGAQPGHLGVELVDLLERQALGLVDEEVDKGNAEEAATEPDEENLALQVGIARAVVDEVGRRVGNGPVEEPLCMIVNVHSMSKSGL